MDKDALLMLAATTIMTLQCRVAELRMELERPDFQGKARANPAVMATALREQEQNRRKGYDRISTTRKLLRVG